MSSLGVTRVAHLRPRLMGDFAPMIGVRTRCFTPELDYLTALADPERTCGGCLYPNVCKADRVCWNVEAQVEREVARHRRAELAAASTRRAVPGNRFGWTRELSVDAIRAHAALHDGVPPRTTDWPIRDEDHPGYSDLVHLFGSFNAAIVAAGFQARRGRPRTRRRAAA